MATVNQNPAAQSSVALTGITYNDITATATSPSWKSTKIVVGGSVAMVFGGSDTTQAVISASLRGKNTSVSSTSASGIFNLEDQIAAKRANAWP